MLAPSTNVGGSSGLGVVGIIVVVVVEVAVETGVVVVEAGVVVVEVGEVVVEIDVVLVCVDVLAATFSSGPSHLTCSTRYKQRTT